MSDSELNAPIGSALRDQLKIVDSRIPLWKKVLICCVLKRAKYKLAQAHYDVARSMLLTENHELGESVLCAGEKLWAELYNVPNSTDNSEEYNNYDSTRNL